MTIARPPEPPKVLAIQGWILRMVVRRTPLLGVALVLLDLATTYAFLAGMLFLLAAVSGTLGGPLAEYLPRGIADAMAGSVMTGLLIAVGFIFLHVAAGVAAAYGRRSLAVRLDASLRADVLANVRLRLGPRPIFAERSGVIRAISSLLTSSRAGVRIARALLAVVPAVLFLGTATAVLLVLEPAMLVWVAMIAIVAVMSQRLANRRVVALEHRYAPLGKAAQRATRPLIALHDLAEPTPAQQREKERLLDERTRTTRVYFSRLLLTDLTQFTVLAAVAAVSLAFLLIAVEARPELLEGALLESLLILLVIGRTIVVSIATIAASQATLAKYAVHAGAAHRYFATRPEPLRPAGAAPPLRLIGPVEPTPHGISYYVDGLDALLGYPADVATAGGAQAPSLALRGPAATGPTIPLLATAGGRGPMLTLAPGDAVIFYRSTVRVRRSRAISIRRLAALFARDAARTHVADSVPDEDIAIDEDV